MNETAASTVPRVPSHSSSDVRVTLRHEVGVGGVGGRTLLGSAVDFTELVHGAYPLDQVTFRVGCGSNVRRGARGGDTLYRLQVSVHRSVITGTTCKPDSERCCGLLSSRCRSCG
jgi:hypothetical protein